jgi:hypothetical protein
MLKKGNVIVIAVVVVLVLVVAAVAYQYKDNIIAPAGHPDGQAGNTPIYSNTSASPYNTITALHAIAIVEGDGAVKAWKNGKSNVGIIQVSTDYCYGGLSDSWMVAYNSDAGKVHVQLNGDTPQGILDLGQAGSASTASLTGLKGLIDSDVACNIALDRIRSEINSNTDYSIDSPSSAVLKFNPDGNAVWEIEWHVGSVNYLVLVDAISGNIVDSSQLQAR